MRDFIQCSNWAQNSVRVPHIKTKRNQHALKVVYRQQVQNEYDEQRMVENFFEDVINIAEMEAQNLKQQNGSVNGAVPSDSTQAYPRDSTYVPMSGVATQQTMSAESYTSQEDYFNMNPYDETEPYVSSERLGTPRKSVLPYQPTCKSLKISETDEQDNEEMGERIVDRRMSDDVFTNGGHVNGGMMPPPPPPPPQMLDLQGMPPPPPPPPPPPGPTMAQNIPQAPPGPPPPGATMDNSIPQVPPAPQQSGDESIYSIPQAPPAPPPTSAGIGHIPQAPPMQAPPQGQPTLGYDSGMPMPPPPPPAPEPALTQNGHVRSKSEDTYMEGVSGDDVPPPPPPMPEGAVIVDDGLPEDFPPPPPMAEFSSEAKQNIAAIRNKFLQEEKTKDVEPTSPQPTPGQQRKQSPRGSGNDETLTEIGLQPGIAAKLAHFHEKQQELSSPPPQPKHNNGASPRKFITPAAAPIYQQPEEIVRKRPPAPTRDPTTRLTMIGNQRLSGIPETGMGSNQSPYAVPDHKRQQQQQQQFRNRTQSTPTSGVAGSADYAHMPNLKQIQRLSMQDVPPPPSTPPPRPPSINMKNIPPAPAEAPPPLPERSPRRSSGGAYQQGMSPRMSPPQTQAAPSPPLPPQAYNKRPVSASIPPPPSLTSIPPPPSVTNPGYAVAPSPPPPAPPSNMARSVPPSSMHIPQQYGNGSMPHQANMASQQYMSMGVPSHPPSKSVPPPPQAPIYSSMNTVPPPPPPSNNLTYMPTTMDIPATQSNHSIYSQPHDTFNPPPPPPQYQMGIPPPPAPSYQRNIPQPPPPSGIPPPPPVVPSVPPPPTAPVPPRIPPSSMGVGLHNGIGNVQLRRTERPEKKMSTGEAPMDNLMAELQSGFRLRPTPKQQKAPSNGGQEELEDDLDELHVDTDFGVVESPHRAEPPRVSPKTRPLSGQFPPPPLTAMTSNIPPAAMTSNMPPAAMTSNIPPSVKSPGPAPKPKPKKKSIPNAEYEHSYPANGSSGLPPEIEEELASLPPWKRAMREKKIREELKKKEEENKKKQEEEAKWAGIPDWKKQMILKKEKKKQEEAEAAIDKEAMELEKKLQAMPAWKREIVQKKMAMEEGPGNNNHA